MAVEGQALPLGVVLDDNHGPDEGECPHDGRQAIERQKRKRLGAIEHVNSQRFISRLGCG